MSSQLFLCRDPAAAGTLSAASSGEARSVWEITASDQADLTPRLGGVSTDLTSSVTWEVSIRVGVAWAEFLTSNVQTPSEEPEEERTASTGSAPSAWIRWTAGGQIR